MGLPKDLGLKGNNFSNAATAFFIAYLIAEVPNGKLPADLHLHVLILSSLFASEATDRKMARSQRDPLGHYNSLYCCGTELPWPNYR